MMTRIRRTISLGLPLALLVTVLPDPAWGQFQPGTQQGQQVFGAAGAIGNPPGQAGVFGATGVIGTPRFPGGLSRGRPGQVFGAGGGAVGIPPAQADAIGAAGAIGTPPVQVGAFGAVGAIGNRRGQAGVFGAAGAIGNPPGQAGVIGAAGAIGRPGFPGQVFGGHGVTGSPGGMWRGVPGGPPENAQDVQPPRVLPRLPPQAPIVKPLLSDALKDLPKYTYKPIEPPSCMKKPKASEELDTGWIALAVIVLVIGFLFGVCGDGTPKATP